MRTRKAYLSIRVIVVTVSAEVLAVVLMLAYATAHSVLTPFEFLLSTTLTVTAMASYAAAESHGSRAEMTKNAGPKN
jgi:sensor histidine kinase YesM